MARDTIEEKQVSLTVKQIAIYLIGVITVISTILATYYNWKAEAKENRTDIDMQHIEIKALQAENEARKAEIQDLKTQIAIINDKIENQKK